MTAHLRHLRLVSDNRGPIVQSNPARPEIGIDLNQKAHEEYRARRNPVDVPLDGPIMQREPMLPLWAVAVAAFVVVFFAAQFARGLFG
jgi:hypothetical protein